MQLDFFTFLLVFLVRGCPDEPKLSSREVEYTLTPRYKPLGDYYVSILRRVGCESVYFRRDMHSKVLSSLAHAVMADGQIFC